MGFMLVGIVDQWGLHGGLGGDTHRECGIDIQWGCEWRFDEDSNNALVGVIGVD